MTGYHRNAWDTEAWFASADGFSWSLIDANFLVPLLQCCFMGHQGSSRACKKRQRSTLRSLKTTIWLFNIAMEHPL